MLVATLLAVGCTDSQPRSAPATSSSSDVSRHIAQSCRPEDGQSFIFREPSQ